MRRRNRCSRFRSRPSSAAPRCGAKRKVFVNAATGPASAKSNSASFNDKMVEIRTGLKEGDEVVINPKVLLGDKVEDPGRRRQPRPGGGKDGMPGGGGEGGQKKAAAKAAAAGGGGRGKGARRSRKGMESKCHMTPASSVNEPHSQATTSI